jgi:hypothetical protein
MIGVRITSIPATLGHWADRWAVLKLEAREFRRAGDAVASRIGIVCGGVCRSSAFREPTSMNEPDFPYEVVDVAHVEPRGDHRLFVRFSNDAEGVRDFAGLVAEGGSMVEPLGDPAFFARVFLDDGILTWPNGFDLDSIALHHEMRTAGLLRVPAT